MDTDTHLTSHTLLSLLSLFLPLSTNMMTTPIKSSSSRLVNPVASGKSTASRKRVAREKLEIVPADKETLQAMKKLKVSKFSPNPQVKTSFCGVFHEQDKFKRLMFFVAMETVAANVKLGCKLTGGIITEKFPFSRDDYWQKQKVVGKLKKGYNPILPSKGDSCVVSGALEMFTPKPDMEKAELEEDMMPVIFLRIDNIKVIANDDSDEEGDEPEPEEEE